MSGRRERLGPELTWDKVMGKVLTAGEVNRAFVENGEEHGRLGKIRVPSCYCIKLL